MFPGDASRSPLPLPDRIVIALDQLRTARNTDDTAAEFAWQQKLDELLDTYGEVLRGTKGSQVR